MKTFIIATILSVGVLLRPQMVPHGNKAQIDNVPVTVATQSQTDVQPLDKADMNAVIGGKFSCFGEIDSNGTSVYQTCCLSFWIIRVCVSVYLGEVMAPLTR